MQVVLTCKLYLVHIHALISLHQLNALKGPFSRSTIDAFRQQGFYVLFLSRKANARVKPAKMGHGPHSS
jgi:hypothetical protein